MGPPIAYLASDVMAEILSYVSELDIFLGLLLCGDKQLDALLSRSVRTLRVFRSTTGRNRLYWPAPRLQLLPHLTAFTLTVRDLPAATSSLIVNSLPKTLLKLHVEASLERTTWLRLSTKMDPQIQAPPSLIPPDMAIGTIEERFPVLEYCHLPVSALPSTTWSPEMLSYFVRTLPRSITYLHLPGISSLHSEVWKLLPPRLSTLKGGIRPVTIEDSETHFDLLPPSLLASLTCVEFKSRDLRPTKVDAKVYAATTHHKPKTEFFVNELEDFSSLVVPPNLTELITTFPVMHHSGCPSSLTSITLVGDKTAMVFVSELFEWIPDSATSLTLRDLTIKYKVSSTEDDDLDYDNLTKKNLRRFVCQNVTHITFSGAETLFFAMTLKHLMPNLEVIEDDCNELVAAMATPKTKRFLMPVNAYKPVLAFSMQDLELITPINFGELSIFPTSEHRRLPVTLTSLRLSDNYPLEDSHLLSLPSLTAVEIRHLSITGSVEELFASCLKLSSSPSLRADTDGVSTLLQKADIFEVPRHGMRLELRRSGNQNRPRFLLHPLPYLLEEPTKLYLGEKAFTKLPSTITKIFAPVDATLVDFRPVRSGLPALESITLDGPVTHSNLNLVPNIRSLEYISSQGIDMVLTMPPNIESFTVGDTWNFRKDDVLPSTLTSLSVGEVSSFAPLEPLKSLTSLSFTSKVKLTPVMEEGIFSLPSCASLTKLEARVNFQFQKLDLLPSLRVWSGAIVSDTIIHDLETRNQQPGIETIHLENATLTSIENDDRFASLVKLPLTEIQSLKRVKPPQSTEKIVAIALEDNYKCITGTRMSITLQRGPAGTNFISSFLSSRRKGNS